MRQADAEKTITDAMEAALAEGVEPQAQSERLQKTGCDSAQGCYFSKPMPVTEFEELLKLQ